MESSTVYIVIAVLFSSASSSRNLHIIRPVPNTEMTVSRNMLHNDHATVDRDENAVAEDNKTCFHIWKTLNKLYIVQYHSNDCSKVDVLSCYCLTSAGDHTTSTTNTATPNYYIGHCVYGCFHKNHVNEYLTISTSDLNGVCANFNREGLLCGQCIANYSPPVYSFTLRCVECQNTTLWKRILLYITVAYGPLTVFLLLIIVFTISVNTAPLHGWIFVCQVIAASNHMRVTTTMAENNFIPNYSYKTFGTVYGIWNLDFFRSLYSPFCLHSSLNTLQVMSLDYVIAAYPIAIIVLMYILVDLHSHDCRLIVVMWKPFRYCFARFRHNLNIRTSLVDAFGTFFTLSYVKMLSTTSDLLFLTYVWDKHDHKSSHVYFDGTMQFLKGKHLPFAIVGFSTLLIYNLLPLGLILVYSFHKTQILLHCFPTSFNNALHPFMDNILGCYKDGTNGTRNCRYFAIVYHLARIALFVSFTATRSLYYYPVILYTCIVTGLLVVIIQPYKSAVYNTLDATLLFSLALGIVGVSAYLVAGHDDPKNSENAKHTAFVTVAIPLLFILGCLCYKIYISERLSQICLRIKIRPLFRSVLRLLQAGMDRRNAEMVDVSHRELCS